MIYVEDVDDVGVIVDRITDAVLAAPGPPFVGNLREPGLHLRQAQAKAGAPLTAMPDS